MAKNHACRFLALVLLVPLAACGASTQSFVAPDFSTIAQSNSIFVGIGDSNGAVSSVGTNFRQTNLDATANNRSLAVRGQSMGMATAHMSNGNGQVALAARELAFELRTLGLRITGTPDDAGVYAILSIGEVRRDPITGWIADQAFLQFTDATTGNVLASYKAEARMITPTVRTIIKNLSAAVRRDLRSG